MPKLKNLKTLLLGLTVILVTFTLFIALPVVVPDLNNMSCERLTGRVVTSKYFTEIWDSALPPSETEWLGSILIAFSGNLSDWMVKRGTGKLGLLYGSDNETSVTVFGYLYYRTLSNEKGEFEPSTGWLGRLIYTPIEITVIEYFEDKEESKKIHVTTDWQGYFSADIELDNDVKCYWIIADYIGNNRYFQTLLQEKFYYPSRASYATCIPEENYAEQESDSYWWMYFSFGIVVITTATFFVLFIKRPKKNITGLSLPLAEEMEIPERVQIKKDVEAGGDVERININFSDIKDSLPSVGGIGEPLDVNITLINKAGDLLSFQPCDIAWGDGESNQEISDENGKINTVHVFTLQGNYAIYASYIDSLTGNKVSSWRKIRIVDYREEMVRLFREMLDNLDMQDVKINSDMTPREIEKMLFEKLEGITREGIRKVVDGFEEANYSTHPVGRDSYVRMYRAVREVVNY